MCDEPAAPGSILVSDYGCEAFILQIRAEGMTTLVLCQSDHVGGWQLLMGMLLIFCVWGSNNILNN